MDAVVITCPQCGAKRELSKPQVLYWQRNTHDHMCFKCEFRFDPDLKKYMPAGAILPEFAPLEVATKVSIVAIMLQLFGSLYIVGGVVCAAILWPTGYRPEVGEFVLPLAFGLSGVAGGCLFLGFAQVINTLNRIAATLDRRSA